MAMSCSGLEATLTTSCLFLPPDVPFKLLVSVPSVRAE